MKAAFDNLRQVATATRSIHPAGAATIFALAWVAGYIGSVYALLVAAALLLGLHLAQRSVGNEIALIDASNTPAFGPVPSPCGPLAGTIADGLIVREIKLGQPPAPRRSKAQK